MQRITPSFYRPSPSIAQRGAYAFVYAVLAALTVALAVAACAVGPMLLAWLTIFAMKSFGYQALSFWGLTAVWFIVLIVCNALRGGSKS